VDGHLQSDKSQVPSTKSQRTPNLQLPNLSRDWAIGTWECVGAWDLALGI
jgi:hypothetical protein